METNKATTTEARVLPVTRLFMNLISNYAGFFVNMVVWFLLTPFLLRHLGTEGYSLWILVTSISAYGLLLNLGATEAVTKYVAEYVATDELKNASRLTATALTIYLAIGVGICGLAGIVAFYLPAFFVESSKQVDSAFWLFFFAGVHIAIAIPCGTSDAVLRGLQRFDMVNILLVSTVTIQAIGSVILILFGGGILSLIMIAIVARLLMQIPAIWAIYRIVPALKFGTLAIERNAVRQVLSFSWPVFVLSVGGHLETKTDEVVIGLSLPIAAIAPYNIAQRLSQLPLLITEQMLNLLLPMASEMNANRNHEQLRHLFMTSTRLAAVVFICCGLPLALLAKPILTLWVGATYASQSQILLILLIASFVDLLLWPASFILQGISKHILPSLMALVTGLLNLFLSLLLIGPWGITGVAIGTLLPIVLLNFWIVFGYALATINIPVKEAVQQIFTPALIPLVPATIIGWFFCRWAVPTTFVDVGLAVIACTLLYATSYLLFFAPSFERTLFRQFQQRARMLVRHSASLIT